MNARASVPALVVGGSVNAIVPQSVEEMWRISTMVVSSGLAPKALIGKKQGNDAASAVAIAVMAGAELGLPPMVALRSFTVIGGRPALYGDGLINVVRRSRKAAHIRTGCDMRDGKMVGWCEAKRADTGEEKREEFSQDDAKRAGLWDERQTVKKQDWETKTWKDVPNEAPWFRYPQRMLQWRAAGFCLRDLFADVLGGITDEYEAREIAGDEPRDITPRTLTPPSAPPVAEEATTIDNEMAPESNLTPGGEFDAAGYFSDLETSLASCNSPDDVEEMWNEYDPLATFDGDDVSIEIAEKIKLRRLGQMMPANAG